MWYRTPLAQCAGAGLGDGAWLDDALAGSRRAGFVGEKRKRGGGS
jgi:hypothetical protein